MGRRSSPVLLKPGENAEGQTWPSAPLSWGNCQVIRFPATRPILLIMHLTGPSTAISVSSEQYLNACFAIRMILLNTFFGHAHTVCAL